jgi:hypothetical protein
MGDSGAMDRVVRAAGGGEVLDRLAALPGADLTTLLLDLMRRRAGRLSPADVLRRYREDRFVAPATVPFDVLRDTEHRVLSLLPAGFRRMTLAPVTPLGTHSVMGAVNQDKVLTTVRGTEAAADATNGLALEAADRRRSDPAVVRLATVQRVVRAQRFSGAGRFAHFGLLGAVTAGRDTGDFGFEREHVAEHARYVMTVAGTGELRLTVAHPRLAPVGAAVRAAVADLPGVTVVDDPDRPGAAGYYAGLCFKAFASRAGRLTEIGDGGLVDWTARLLGNRKERLVISGLGIEGVATL